MQTIKAAVCHEFGAPLVVEDIHIRAPLRGEIEVTFHLASGMGSTVSIAPAIPPSCDGGGK